jgi:hypothetical protein
VREREEEEEKKTRKLNERRKVRAQKQAVALARYGLIKN